jgi:hypothetical protein
VLRVSVMKVSIVLVPVDKMASISLSYCQKLLLDCLYMAGRVSISVVTKKLTVSKDVVDINEIFMTLK